MSQGWKLISYHCLMKCIVVLCQVLSVSEPCDYKSVSLNDCELLLFKERLCHCYFLRWCLWGLELSPSNSLNVLTIIEKLCARVCVCVSKLGRCPHVHIRVKVKSNRIINVAAFHTMLNQILELLPPEDQLSNLI